MSTSYALICLARTEDSARAARGYAYLLGQQGADGSIASAPDSIGPRPFTFGLPALTDYYALLALGHCGRRFRR